MNALPEKHRLARNLHEGWEILDEFGHWRRVASVLHITAPLQVSAFTFDDGTEESCSPRERVMSRKPAGGAA